MIYYVTPLLHVDRDHGNMSADVAEECLKNGEEAVVPSFATAVQVLTRFGLTKSEAVARVRFARTGSLG